MVYKIIFDIFGYVLDLLVDFRIFSNQISQISLDISSWGLWELFRLNALGNCGTYRFFKLIELALRFLFKYTLRHFGLNLMHNIISLDVTFSHKLRFWWFDAFCFLKNALEVRLWGCPLSIFKLNLANTHFEIDVTSWKLEILDKMFLVWLWQLHFV